MNLNEARRISEMCEEVSLLFEPPSSAPPEYWKRVATLLFGTALHESGMFRYRRQMGFLPDTNDGAFSYWQMERAAIAESMDRLLMGGSLYDAVWSNLREEGNPSKFLLVGMEDAVEPAIAALDFLQWPCGDYLACVLARLYYLSKPGLIPESLQDQAAYWKKYWNTELGAGTVQQYIDHWLEWKGQL